jgi:hypothetical protein
LGIYTPEEAAQITVPTNLGDAVAKGVINALCRGAPLLAGYGLLTGNLPALAFGAGGSIACGLPIVPLEEVPPPAFLPFVGGQCRVLYRVFVRRRVSNADSCSVVSEGVSDVVALGPISIRTGSNNTANTRCLGEVRTISDQYLEIVDGNGGVVQQFGGGWPDLGDFVAVEGIVRLDGGLDDCGNPPLQNPVLPPGITLPPGYPDNPVIPRVDVPVPYRPPGSPPGKPPVIIPIPVGPIILPPIIAPSFNPSIPINVPVSIPVSISPNVSITIPVQIGPSGEIRTPPDLICPCEYGEEEPSGAPNCPELIDIEVPYYSCDSGGEFLSSTLSVVRSTLPSDLLSDLLSSSNLAQIGCESIAPDQLPAVRLESSRTPDFGSPPYYSVLLPEDVVSVELRITEFSPREYRELSTFPLGEQRKFGSMSYCIDGVDGGDNPTYIWDTSTYFRLPKRAKPGRLKILLRPSISFELWDTGERF